MEAIMFSRFATVALTAVALGLVAVPARAQVVVPDDVGVTSEDARDIAAEQGVRVIDSMRFNRTMNRWEIYGRDARDRDVDVDIDANTGAILDLDRD
jgi:hypothetical protein